jgi:hypothetical protein
MHAPAKLSTDSERGASRATVAMDQRLLALRPRRPTPAMLEHSRALRQEGFLQRLREAGL